MPTLPEFQSDVFQLSSNPAFYTKQPEEREKILRDLTDAATRDTPDLTKGFQQISGDSNIFTRRALGQGRYIPETDKFKINLPADFDTLAPEEQEVAIQKARTQDVTGGDYLNATDIEYYKQRQLDGLERQALGGDTGWVGDKSKRLMQGFFGGLANMTGQEDLANSINQFFHENPKYDPDWSAKFAEGVGSTGAAIGVFLGASALGGPEVGTAALLAGNTAMRYNQAYAQATDLGYDDSTATDAGFAAVPAAVIDTFADRLLGSGHLPKTLGGILEAGTAAERRAAITEFAKTFNGKQALAKIATEAVTNGALEVVGDYTAGYGPYMITNNDKFIPTKQQLFDDFTIGLAIGGLSGGISEGGDIGFERAPKVDANGNPILDDKGNTKKTLQVYSKTNRLLGQIGDNMDIINGYDTTQRKQVLSDQVYDYISKGDLKKALDASEGYKKLPGKPQWSLNSILSDTALGPDVTNETLTQLDTNNALDANPEYADIYDQARQDTTGIFGLNLPSLDDEDRQVINSLGYKVNQLEKSKIKYANDPVAIAGIDAQIGETMNQMNGIGFSNTDRVNPAIVNRINSMFGISSALPVREEIVNKYGIFPSREKAQIKANSLNGRTDRFLFGVRETEDGFEITRQNKTTTEAAPQISAENYKNITEAFRAQDRVDAAFAKINTESANFNIYDSTVDALLGINQPASRESIRFGNEEAGQQQTQLNIELSRPFETGEITGQTAFMRAQEASGQQAANVSPQSINDLFNLESTRNVTRRELGSGLDWDEALQMRRNHELNPGERITITGNDNEGYTATLERTEILGKVKKNNSAAESARFIQQQITDADLAKNARRINQESKGFRNKQRPRGFQSGQITIPTLEDFKSIGTNIKEAFNRGAEIFNAGLQNFTDWSGKMIQSFGEGIKKFLGSMWQSIGDAVYDHLSKIGAIQFVVDPNQPDSIQTRPEVTQNKVTNEENQNQETGQVSNEQGQPAIQQTEGQAQAGTEIRQGESNQQGTTKVASDTKQILTGKENLKQLRKGRISDKTDSRTQNIISALKGIDMNELDLLSKPDQLKFYALVNNVMDSRSGKANSPAMRLNSDQVIEEINGYKNLLDTTFIENAKAQYGELINFDDFSYSNRNDFISQLNAKIGGEEYASAIGSDDATSEKLNQKYVAWRQQANSVRDQLKAQHIDAEDWLTKYEQNQDYGIISPKLRDFIKFHYDYLQTTDFDQLSGVDLYRHFYAINGINDGSITYLRDTSIKEFARMADAKSNLDKYQSTFRDPVSTGRGIISNLDQLSKNMEIAQVQLERFSAFPETQQFLQENLAGDFLDSVVRDYTNAKAKSNDEYLEAKKRFEETVGREMNGDDRMVMAIISRLAQGRIGSDMSKELLINVHNENQSVQNVQNNGNRDTQRFYNETYGNVVKAMTDGLEDFQGDDLYQYFSDTLADRMSYNANQSVGAARLALLDNMMEIIGRHKTDSKVISEGFYEIPFEEQFHYFPKETVSLEKASDYEQFDFTDTAENIAGLTYHDNSYTSKPGHLQTRKGIGNNRFYSHNIESIFDNKLNAILFNTNTVASRFVLKERIKEGSPIYEMISHDEVLDKSGRTRRVHDLENWAAHIVSNSLNKGEALGQIGEAARGLNTLFSRVVLSSAHQAVTQAVSGLSDYSIRTGNMPGAIDGMQMFITDRTKVDEWFDRNARWITNRALLGENELDIRRAPNFDQNALANHPMFKAIGKIFKGADKVLLASMRFGDDITARSVVLAEYARLLNEKGYAGVEKPSDIDFNSPVEGQLLTQAILNAEKSFNTSSKILKGEFFTDRKNIYTIARNLMFAYSGHQMSLSSQIWGAVRNLHDLKQAGASSEAMIPAIRRIGAILGQTAAFSASRFAINAGIASVIVGMIRDLYDQDENKIANLELAKQQAIAKGDTDKANALDVELRANAAIRKHINQFEQKSLTFESFFKSAIKEQASSLHFAFNLPGVVKIAAMIPDAIEQKAFKEEHEKQLGVYSTQIKKLKEAGNLRAAAKLEQERMDYQNLEFIPIAYNDTNGVGIGGLMGASVRNLVDIAGNANKIAMGTTDASWADLALSANVFGIGQNDVNKGLRIVDKIENDLKDVRDKADAARAKKQQELKQQQQQAAQARERLLGL